MGGAKRGLRWIKRIVLGLLALSVVAIIVGLIAIHTDWGRDLARKQVESALASSFPGGAKVGVVEGSILGTLTVHDLELDGLDGKPFIVVKTARIRIALAPLVRHIARIELVELDDVLIDKHPQPARPPEIPEVPKPPSAWSVELPDIAVTHARIHVATETRTIDVVDVDATASLSIDTGAITVAARAAGAWSGRKVDATAIVRYVRGTVALPFAEATVGKASVLGMGVHVGSEIDGVVSAWIPAETAKALAAIELPGDVALLASAHAGAVDAQARMASATVRAVVQANLAAKSAQGLVIADVRDGAALDRRFAGSGIVTASVDASMDHVRGIVTLDGVRPVDPMLFGPASIRGKTLVAVDASLTNAWLFIEAGFDLGRGHATVIAELTRAKDGAIAIVKSNLIATARKIGARKTDLSIAYISANARASGPLWPKPELHVVGMLGGDELRFAKTAIETVDVRFDATRSATTHVDVTGVRQGPRLLGSVSLDAHGTLDANNVITAEIDSHTITTAANGVWSGAGGHVVVDLPTVTVRDFRTGNADGTVVVNAAYAKDTSDLDGSVDAKNVSLATLAPGLKGTVGAKLTIARHGGRWSGGGTVTGKNLELPNRPLFDVDGKLAVAGRRVTVDATATSQAGTVTIVADVDGPNDLTDGAAWQRLERRALRTVSVELAHVDGTKLGATGIADGKVALTAKDATGEIRVREIQTKAGAIDGKVAFASRGTDVAATITANLEAVDTFDGAIVVALPAHVFDPAAWQALGRGVVRSATFHAHPVDVDPKMLARLHVVTPYHGRVEATVVVTEGVKDVTAAVDVTRIGGGLVKQPVDVHLEGTIDDHTAHVAMTGKTGAITFVTAAGSAPFDVDHPRDLLTAPITGTIEIPSTPAKDLAAILGRNDVSAGKLEGTITVAGIVSVPTGDLKLTADGVTIPASVSGRPPAKLEKLVATGHWGGVSGEVDINGTEGGGGILHLAARGRPDQLATLAASFEAARFDIAPFAAFMPGALAGARGVVDASLVLKGFDPDTGDLRGMLQIHGGRLPLSSLLGTMRAAEVELSIAGHKVNAKLDAKLGKGTIKGTGTVVLVGSTPSKAEADVTLAQISLIRAFQPTIDARITATFAHGPSQWTGNIVVSKGHVLVASAGGAKLLDVGAPDDMIFVDKVVAPTTSVLTRPPPSRPWLIAAIEIKPTTIDILQDQLEVRGGASGKLTMSLGQGSVGLDGEIDAQRGDIDLLGSRSLLDHGSLVFDGTIDPLLDVRVIRELGDLTITADITGRLSDPTPQLSSDTGSYTQGELYSFFLGGQPSGDRSEVGQAAIAAGAGIASSVVSKQLNQRLFSKLFPHTDLKFNYEAASASSSDAIRVGFWYNRRIFLAGRSHFAESRVDENQYEGILELHLTTDSLIQANVGDRGYDGADYVRRYRW